VQATRLATSFDQVRQIPSQSHVSFSGVFAKIPESGWTPKC